MHAFHITSLVKSMRENDVLAFEALFHEFFGQMYYLAYKLVGDSETAKQIAKDTFISAYEQRGRFSRANDFVVALEKQTFKGCKKALEDGELPGGQAPSSAARDTGWLRMVDRLSRPQKATLILRGYFKNSLREMSAIMDCPGDIVDEHRKKAMRQINEHLSRYGVVDMLLGRVFLRMNTTWQADAAQVVMSNMSYLAWDSVRDCLPRPTVGETSRTSGRKIMRTGPARLLRVALAVGLSVALAGSAYLLSLRTAALSSDEGFLSAMTRIAINTEK